jgi:pimeloyl-ACP methyl ester carboxylesterase
MNTRKYAIVAITMLALCSANARASQHPTIVLLHGAFETAAVWKQVRIDLRARGYRSIAIDLPGRTGNPLPASKATLKLYRDAVLQVLERQHGPVVLVAHSFGGITASAVAEAAPEKIRTIVYVAAYLPQSGDSLVSMSGRDSASQVGPHFKVTSDKSMAFIEPSAAAALFCNGCDERQSARVARDFVSEPLAPLATPVSLTAERFGKVDKVYIHTSNDVVVSPAYQAAMVAATPVRKELSVPTAHAAFVQSPAALTESIIEAIE